MSSGKTMKKKQLIILLGALLVLIALGYLAGAFERDFSTVNVPQLNISTSELDHLQLGLTDQTVVFEKKESLWQMTEPITSDVDSTVVARFVTSLVDMELESVVSTNPERYDRYGVDSTGTSVTASWSGNSRTLFVGDRGPDYQSVYVRLDDDPRVFLTSSSLTIHDQLDRWRDKVVIILPYLNVVGASVISPESSYEVSIGPGGWQVNEGGSTVAADSAAVVRWLQRFSPMRADGFVDDIPATFIEAQGTHKVTFRTTVGAAPTISFMLEGTNYAVSSSMDDVTFSILKSRINTFVPEVSTLYVE